MSKNQIFSAHKIHFFLSAGEPLDINLHPLYQLHVANIATFCRKEDLLGTNLTEAVQPLRYMETYLTHNQGILKLYLLQFY